MVKGERDIWEVTGVEKKSNLVKVRAIIPTKIILGKKMLEFRSINMVATNDSVYELIKVDKEWIKLLYES